MQVGSLAGDKMEVSHFFGAQNDGTGMRDVVGIVGTPADATAFPGLFVARLPARCWSVLDGSAVLVVTSVWHSTTRCLAIDCELSFFLFFIFLVT